MVFGLSWSAGRTPFLAAPFPSLASPRTRNSRLKAHLGATLWAGLALLLPCSFDTEAKEQPILSVLITIDVETSSGCTKAEGCFPPPISDRILGEHEGVFYGTPLIMDLLEKRDMRGTFFVNAYLDSFYQEDEIRAVVEEIVQRGHSVQFHAHEEFRCFRYCKEEDAACRKSCLKNDSYLGGNSLDKQLEILEEGARNIQRWSGTYPVAFRGGSWDADRVTLDALRILGIPLEFSLSGFEHKLADQFSVNRVTTKDGITEVPVYLYRQSTPFKFKPRYWDIESGTFLEHKVLLQEALDSGLKTAVLVMHSFSFCRRDLGCPNQTNIDRFDRLLAFIDAHPMMQTITTDQFLSQYRQAPEKFEGSGYVPSASYFLVVYRSFVQFGESWKHATFFCANIFAVLIILVVIAYLVRRVYLR